MHFTLIPDTNERGSQKDSHADFRLQSKEAEKAESKDASHASFPGPIEMHTLTTFRPNRREPEKQNQRVLLPKSKSPFFLLYFILS